MYLLEVEGPSGPRLLVGRLSGLLDFVKPCDPRIWPPCQPPYTPPSPPPCRPPYQPPCSPHCLPPCRPPCLLSASLVLIQQHKKTALASHLKAFLSSCSFISVISKIIAVLKSKLIDWLNFKIGRFWHLKLQELRKIGTWADLIGQKVHYCMIGRKSLYFLDAIASPCNWCCQWVGQPVGQWGDNFRFAIYISHVSYVSQFSYVSHVSWPSGAGLAFLAVLAYSSSSIGNFSNSAMFFCIYRALWACLQCIKYKSLHLMDPGSRWYIEQCQLQRWRHAIKCFSPH